MITQTCNSVTRSLLPEDAVSKLETGRSSQAEKLLGMAYSLVTQVVLRTIDIVRNREYKKLDSNPMDYGCQNRALVLRGFDLAGLTEDLWCPRANGSSYTRAL